MELRERLSRTGFLGKGRFEDPPSRVVEFSSVGNLPYGELPPVCQSPDGVPNGLLRLIRSFNLTSLNHRETPDLRRPIDGM